MKSYKSPSLTNVQYLLLTALRRVAPALFGELDIGTPTIDIIQTVHDEYNRIRNLRHAIASRYAEFDKKTYTTMYGDEWLKFHPASLPRAEKFPDLNAKIFDHIYNFI